MKTKSIFIKSISLSLVLLMLFTSLLSCAGGIEGSGESSDFTDDSAALGSDANGNDVNDEGEGDGGEQNASGSIVIVENGEYVGKVVRPDMPNDIEKTMFNDIRALFKAKVGKNPNIETDFDTHDGPAILIGDTNCTESKSVKLKEGQAKATIVGNKYVIKWTTDASAIELFDEIKTIFNKNAKKENVTITSKWNKTVTVEEVKFDENGLKASIPLPDISSTGLKWNTNGRDSGHGSKIYIANNANATHFTKYVAALKSAGFTAYATNKLHTNEFATFVTKEQIVHVMFFAPKNVIKVTVDPRSTFGLPGIKGENDAPNPNNTPTQFVQLGMRQVSSEANGMGYIVKLPNGKFIVVDGGFAYDNGGGGGSATFLINTMKKMQGNNNKPVIAAFIITHIHTDHAGGFMGMANKHKNDVTIEKLVYNQPSDAQMNSVSNMSGRKNWVPNAINTLKKAGSLQTVVKAHPGMQLHYTGLTITIMGSIDVIENSDHKKMENGNNASVVCMFEMYGKKVLITGDSEPLESKAIRDIYGGIGNTNSVLKADFTQTPHHGYGNTNTDNLSGNDQNALNVMASGGVTAAGQSKTYALVPVALWSGSATGGYLDDSRSKGSMQLFPANMRLVAADKNMTITFNTNGTYTIDKEEYNYNGHKFWVGTWKT